MSGVPVPSLSFMELSSVVYHFSSLKTKGGPQFLNQIMIVKPLQAKGR
jgi:hypothetical protein